MAVIFVQIMLQNSWQPVATYKGVSGSRVDIKPACQPAPVIQHCIVIFFPFSKSCPGALRSW